MENYYHLLKLEINATAEEINAALDYQYNQVRRLVNHHDPVVVNKANEQLVLLETIRSILLNPSLRSQYDQTLSGHADNVGGLIDPTIQQDSSISSMGYGSSPISFAAPLNPANLTSSTLPSPQPQIQEVETSWICPRCHNPNPEFTQFCKRCGEPVGVVCPDCAQISDISSAYCSSCGVKLDQAIRKKEINNQISKKQKTLAEQESKNPRQDERIKELQIVTARSLSWVITGLLVLYNLYIGATGTLRSFEFYIGVWIGSVILNWILAAVFKIPLSALGGPSWTNFFLLLPLAAWQYTWQMNSGYELANSITLFHYIVLFFLGMAVPRNIRSSLEKINENEKSYGGLKYLLRLIVLILVAFPIINILIVFSNYDFGSAFPDYYLRYYPILRTITQISYILVSCLFLVFGLIGLRLLGKVKFNVRVALEEQQKTIEDLKAKIDLLKRELNSLI